MHETAGREGPPVQALVVMAGVAGEEDLLVIVRRHQQLEAWRSLLPGVTCTVEVSQYSQQIHLQPKQFNKLRSSQQPGNDDSGQLHRVSRFGW